MLVTRTILVLLMFGLAGCVATNGPTPAEELLGRSIAYHDPGDVWKSKQLTVTLESARPNGETRIFEIEVENTAGRFDMRVEWGGKLLEFVCAEDDCVATVDGSEDVSPEDMEKYVLERDGGSFWRNYFTFLLGLPMKVRDPGTHLDPDVRREVFDGHEVESVRFTFDPEVGGDTWYLYFDPETAALRGYRFYHDESKNDGEYITLEGEVEIKADGLRLPKIRSWYVNADDELLGTDTITSLAVTESSSAPSE